MMGRWVALSFTPDSKTLECDLRKLQFRLSFFKQPLSIFWFDRKWGLKDGYLLRICIFNEGTLPAQ